MDYSYYKNLLDRTRYCTVGTCSNNFPHSSPVFFHATWEGIFWTSARVSQHSKNILQNPNTFITLFPEGLGEGTGSQKGLYLQGTARVLTVSEEIYEAKVLSTEKANRDHVVKKTVLDSTNFMGDSVRAVYHFIPERVWTNSWSTDKGDFRVDLDMSNLFIKQLVEPPFVSQHINHRFTLEELLDDRTILKGLLEKCIGNIKLIRSMQVEVLGGLSNKLLKCTLEMPYFDSAESKCTSEMPYFDSLESKCTLEMPYFDSAESKCTSRMPYFDSLESKCTLEMPYFDSKESKCTIQSTFTKKSLVIRFKEGEVLNGEVTLLRSLAKYGQTLPVKCTFANGYISQYIPGVTLNRSDHRTGKHLQLVAKRLRQLHDSPIISISDNQGDIWTSMNQWLSFLEKDRRWTKEQIVYLRDTILRLRKQTELYETEKVFCHNDLTYENILGFTDDTGAEHINFIDWEYSGYNWYLYDIANFFREWASNSLTNPLLTQDEQNVFLESYFVEDSANNRKPSIDWKSPEFRYQLELCTQLSDLHWSIWSFYKDITGSESELTEFYYLDYGIRRFRRSFGSIVI